MYVCGLGRAKVQNSLLNKINADIPFSFLILFPDSSCSSADLIPYGFQARWQPTTHPDYKLYKLQFVSNYLLNFTKHSVKNSSNIILINEFASFVKRNMIKV